MLLWAWGGQEISIDSGRRSSTALSSKCEQCLVVSRRRKLNTDSLDCRTCCVMTARCTRHARKARAVRASINRARREHPQKETFTPRRTTRECVCGCMLCRSIDTGEWRYAPIFRPRTLPRCLNATNTCVHAFNGPFSRTTRVSGYQKRKTSVYFSEAKDSEWQWHQLGRMHVCTSLQTDNHARTHHSQIFTDYKFFFADRLSNKPFLIWLLTTPPNLKYVATLPCNLSLVACFLT